MASITAQTAKLLGDEGNIREDLGNVIFNVSPFKTPFFSGSAKAKATADNHEWLTDTLRPAASNFNIESETFTSADPGQRVRLGNYMGIAQEQATVTLKAEILDKAGVPGKEMAYQLMKKGKELQMDVELDLLSINPKVAPTGSVAGEVGSVAAYIGTNQQTQGGTDNPGSSGVFDGSTVPTPGSNTALTEPMVTDAIDGVWNASGDLDNHCIMGNAAIVGKIRGLSGMSDDWQNDASGGTIYNKVTVYMSQFGPVKVVPNKHMPANTCYILDMSSWAIAFGGGKAIHTTDIATLTAAESKLLEMYYTMEARSEEANAAIYALTE